MTDMASRPIFLGIAGGSGSGKTFLAHQIERNVGSDVVAVLSMDRYFRTKVATDASSINFDHPGHIDLDQMLADLAELRLGRAVQVPSYDFLRMEQTPRATRIDPKPVIVVEGLFVLGKPIVDELDVTCFLDVADDQRLLGRILRDLEERGATVEQIVDRYQRYVRPSYTIFVAPARQNADVVVDFTYRRALFMRLLVHVVRDYVQGNLDLPVLLREVGRETYTLGYPQHAGTMPISIDLRELAKTFPEQSFPKAVPEQVGPAALFLTEPNSKDKNC